MKYLSALLFVTVMSHMLQAQTLPKPDWVLLFQRGQSLPDSLGCYCGVGVSSQSQEDADAKARQEFALHVESHVQSIISRSAQESEREYKEEYSAFAQV
ncbi:MAG TPA: hypothetical protein VFO86_06130, partial [Terriglobia bacterium]|nr:hypothetical protein [Terriglobia bacterium]